MGEDPAKTGLTPDPNAGGGDGGGGTPEEKKYSWGGKELTSDEIYEEAKKSFSSKSQMEAILKDPEKLATYYNENFATKDDDADKTPAPKGDEVDERIRSELKKYGVITADEFEKYKEEQAEQFQIDRNQIKEEIRIENRLTSLEKEIDGKDGRPKFVLQDVIGKLKELRAEGLIGDNLTKEVILGAYERLHESDLSKWRAEQAKNTRDKARPLFSERGAGGNKNDEKPPPKITFDGGKDSISAAEAVAQLNVEE